MTGLPTQTGVELAEKPTMVGAADVLVRPKVWFAVAPLALAVTLYEPDVALAVTVRLALVPEILAVPEAGLVLAPDPQT